MMLYAGTVSGDLGCWENEIESVLVGSLSSERRQLSAVHICQHEYEKQS